MTALEGLSPDDRPAASVEMVRHEEEVRIGVTSGPYRRVRVRLRVITEVRHIEVEVRTQVLDVDWLPADHSGGMADDGVGSAERLEFVLLGEEPEVRLVTLAKERVVLRKVVVPGACDVEATVRSERIALDGRPSPPG